MDWATFDGGENEVSAAPFKELLFKFVLEELGDLDGASRVLGLQRASLWRADVGSELFNDANRAEVKVQISRVQAKQLALAQPENCCATDECLEVRVRVSDQGIELVECERPRFARLMLWYANRVERVERNEHFCDCVVENSPHELNRYLFHARSDLACEKCTAGVGGYPVECRVACEGQEVVAQCAVVQRSS